MMHFKSTLAVLTAGCLLCTAAAIPSAQGTASLTAQAATSDSIENQMDWGTVEIGGGGFVSGIITGKKTMLARTDVGGAYKYNYETKRWEQLMAFLNEEDRGMLSIDAFCIDPTDDNTFYLLAGCAYFSGARTEIFKTTDGGETFTRIDVTDLIQVHANGYGRQCGEAIAVDPDNPNILYCGGDVTAGDSCLIMSKDGGETWSPVKGYDDLGLFKNTLKWPTWTDHVVRAATTAEYGSQNGVATIHIQGGKVYVGTSVQAEGNMVVADVGSDDFTVLSKDLPTNSYPSRINVDADGNLLLCYIGGLTFNGTGGGIYRYNPTDQTVTDISPSGNSFSACMTQPDNANALIATTCGVWSTQSWSKDDSPYGDWLYRSMDGGKTWTTIYPGKMGDYVWDPDSGEMHQNQLYGYLQNGGFDWIYGKAIHWTGALVLNPEDSSQIFVTSGNGVFEWDNIWPDGDTDNPVATFHPNGIEEVVALDMVSVPGGAAYSAIGDYDGFKHTDTTVSGEQHQPNMGSTAAIAYCPQNPDVMIRIAEHQNDIAPGYYTLDGGKTWTKMANSPGGRAAITQLEDGTYRFFKSDSSSDQSAGVSYSDDFGQTWSSCTGIPSSYGSKPTNMFVDPDQPNLVYAYVTYYNSSWGYSKPAAELSDAQYNLCVSTDYGKTFTSTTVCMYDQCDSAGRIAYLGDGKLALAAGWYGAYRVSDSGKTIEKMENVSYCKTMGYGAPEKEGGMNTLFMYGKPDESDPEGIYRSTDGGDTWVCINTQKLYGGTGNGNFLVGDMNEFGKVYMSTVGCGIVVGSLSDNPKPPVTTTTTTATTTTTTTTTAAGTTTTDLGTTTGKVTTTGAETTTTGKVTGTTAAPNPTAFYGDVNLDNTVSLADLITFQKQQRGALDFNAQQTINANCDLTDSEITPQDVTTLLSFLIGKINTLPVQ